jgi:hypothetical protein
VTYPGFTPVGNATLVVANVLTCNKHSQKKKNGGVSACNSMRCLTAGTCRHGTSPHTLSQGHIMEGIALHTGS